MGFNAQLRSDIETLDVTINNYERMANAPEAWSRIKNILAEEKILQSGEAPHQQTQGVICPSFKSGLKCLFIEQGMSKYRCGSEPCKLTPVR